LNLYQTATQLFYELSQVFFWPVCVALLVLFGWSLVDAGGLAYEAWRRRGQARTDLGGLGGRVEEYFTRGIPLSGMSPELARFWARVEPGLGKTLGEKSFDLWLERMVEDEELAIANRLDRTRAMVRLGPMLGLAGTIIPLGPALQALLSGQMAEMVNHLVIGFGAVVSGLVLSGIAYVTTLLRERWARVEVREMEDLVELLLRAAGDGARDRAEAK
jgi:biopolymer transport protein ExbB/TolQ